jgi:hypothetical protein
LPSSELDYGVEWKQSSKAERLGNQQVVPNSGAIGPAVVSGGPPSCFSSTFLAKFSETLAALKQNSHCTKLPSVPAMTAMNTAPIRYLDLFTKHFYCRDADGQHANDTLLPVKLDKLSCRPNM